VLGQSVK
jgi:beta-phosphoglucomutase-like phosphatase (HAD superfamily)